MMDNGKVFVLFIIFVLFEIVTYYIWLGEWDIDNHYIPLKVFYTILSLICSNIVFQGVTSIFKSKFTSV